jgi:hypothetical protein
MASGSKRSLKEVIDMVNKNKNYREEFFRDPKAFLERELDVKISRELSEEIKDLVGGMEKQLGSDILIALPGSAGTPKKGDIYP